ncbi:amidohydrolase [Solibacillus daqui]|uniref:amidohydrolase n=1 Tax=Solibacillus daqui TaxID=2912187 RepID=UPI0030839411
MSLLLKNVRLETGYQFENEEVIRTNTELMDILMEDGVFKKIEKQIEPSENVTVLDAKGRLLLPSLKDMHIHLDKTYYSGPWKAPTIAKKGIWTRIEEEQQLLPKQLPVMVDRAQAIIELLISNGHTHIRTHCNVDPLIGTKHVELVLELLENYRDKITYELVAFPQHGLLHSQVEQQLQQALQMGATHIGGLDPATVDQDINRSLETMVRLAHEADKGIDIHLHDGGTLGEYEIHRLMDYLEHYQFKNEVTISHAFALADISTASLEKLMERMKKHQINIATTVPFGQNRPTIPVFHLTNSGIGVAVGHDSLTDHWSPFGSGDTVDKLKILAERFYCSDERRLGQCWKFGSGNITPLNEQGLQQWPKIGDEANAVLVEAVCSAQVIARNRPIEYVLFRGNVTFEKQ